MSQWSMRYIGERDPVRRAVARYYPWSNVLLEHDGEPALFVATKTFLLERIDAIAAAVRNEYNLIDSSRVGIHVTAAGRDGPYGPTLELAVRPEFLTLERHTATLGNAMADA